MQSRKSGQGRDCLEFGSIRYRCAGHCSFMVVGCSQSARRSFCPIALPVIHVTKSSLTPSQDGTRSAGDRRSTQEPGPGDACLDRVPLLYLDCHCADADVGESLGWLLRTRRWPYACRAGMWLPYSQAVVTWHWLPAVLPADAGCDVDLVHGRLWCGRSCCLHWPRHSRS